MIDYKPLYNQLLNDEIPYFVYNYSNPVSICEHILNVYAGSFNPLHDMHKLVYNSATEYSLAHKTIKNALTAYEISVIRRNKEFLGFDDLMGRLQQFSCEPVIVTKADFYVKKTGALRGKNITFHMGFDTAQRLISDDTILGIQGINAQFVVYPRDNIGIETLDCIPVNFCQGKYVSKYEIGISSTAIRELHKDVTIKNSIENSPKRLHTA